jgi:hypothetical protein
LQSLDLFLDGNDTVENVCRQFCNTCHG